ncbi:MAG: hypothetical protein K1060chlam5_00580 [Candidatus Anoxychlamydiales bacterium]|nr:hypothetical protein [Candidatus Anoxychlamydiales bacterium]
MQDNIKKLSKDTIDFLNGLENKRLVLSDDSYHFFKKDIENQLTKKTHFSTPDKPSFSFENKISKSNIGKDNFRKETTATIPNKIENSPSKEKNIFNEKIEKDTSIETKDTKEPIKIDKPVQSEFSANEKIEIPNANFNEIKSIIKKISNLEFEKPLNDKFAKEILNKHKYKDQISPILILAYTEDEKSFKFLQKLSIAITNYFAECKIILAYELEKKDSWHSILDKSLIKYIITTDYTIFEMKNLKKYFLENSSKKEKFLNEIPLILLPDIILYLKEPMLKASLFKMLNQKLKNINE